MMQTPVPDTAELVEHVVPLSTTLLFMGLLAAMIAWVSAFVRVR